MSSPTTSGHLGQARDPRGREEVPRRGQRPVRVRGRVPQDQEGARRHRGAVHRHGQRAARPPRPREGALRHADPVQRQQVRGAEHRRVVGRVVHLRAAGCAGRYPAAGLLPDQRREHGPVRAHADHRRRGQLRALRRGVLGADLLERLAALRRRRDQGDEGRACALHDDPELVDERLQPRDEARGRLRGRRDGVGRRQHRLEGHDEVPVDLPARRGRARRGAVGGLRRQGHASPTPAAKRSTRRRTRRA